MKVFPGLGGGAGQSRCQCVHSPRFYLWLWKKKQPKQTFPWCLPIAGKVVWLILARKSQKSKSLLERLVHITSHTRDTRACRARRWAPGEVALLQELVLVNRISYFTNMLKSSLVSGLGCVLPSAFPLPHLGSPWWPHHWGLMQQRGCQGRSPPTFWEIGDCMIQI